jgi:hypothetical protein
MESREHINLVTLSENNPREMRGDNVGVDFVKVLVIEHKLSLINH